MMAHYDPRTDTIHGCEPGTYAYHHEMRHREQYKNGNAETLDKLYVICYYASFLCAVGGWIVAGPWGMVQGIGLSFLPHVLSMAYLEADAYLFGWINWRRGRK